VNVKIVNTLRDVQDVKKQYIKVLINPTYKKNNVYQVNHLLAQIAVPFVISILTLENKAGKPI
jgi:hypothetical protein